MTICPILFVCENLIAHPRGNGCQIPLCMKGRDRHHVSFLEADVLPEPTQRCRCPPVECPKQAHGGWKEQHTNECGIHNDCKSQANANLLNSERTGQAKAAKHNCHEKCGTGNEPASALYA